MKILVAYASAHGSTGEVGEFIGRMLRAYGVDVTVANVKDVHAVTSYDVLILGSAIHGSLWLQEMYMFLDRFKDALTQKTLYFWVSCIRALEGDGRKHALQYYFDYQALEAFHVRAVAVFTGKLDISAITREEQWFLVGNYDGKLTPGNIHHDYRDWEAIATWATTVAKDLQLHPIFEPAVASELVGY